MGTAKDEKDTVDYGEGLGFRESGPAGKQQPGPRMGEGGERTQGHPGPQDQEQATEGQNGRCRRHPRAPARKG